MRRSRGGFETIFVVEAAQNRRRHDSMAGEQLMTRRPDHTVPRSIRNPGSQAAMGSAAIVMADPLAKNGVKVALVEWNNEVDTLTTDGPDQALAKGIRLWNPDRRFEGKSSPWPVWAES